MEKHVHQIIANQIRFFSLMELVGPVVNSKLLDRMVGPV